MGVIREFIRKTILFPEYVVIRERIRSENCLILLGTSSYNNLGDHLLSHNSLEFLKHCFPNKTIVEISSRIIKRFVTGLSNAISRNAVVLISAGGWMGNLWEEDELCMQKMLKAFSQNKIYILPQTVYYDKSLKNYKTLLTRANECYKACADLTLFVRESNSYYVAKNILAIDKVYLVPDMGLYGKKRIKSEDNCLNALLCFRNDKEALIDKSIENNIIKFLLSKNYSVDRFDTVKSYNIPSFIRKYHINRFRNYLERNVNIVFTDRLHGMIFAVISGCKCVAFDNKNHKVSGVYNDWLKANPNVLLVEDSNPFDISKVNSLVDSKQVTDYWANIVDSKFGYMSEIIRREIKD